MKKSLAFLLMLPMLAVGQTVQLGVYFKHPYTLEARSALIKRAGCTEILRIDSNTQWSNEVTVPAEHLKAAKKILKKKAFVDVVTAQ